MIADTRANRVEGRSIGREDVKSLMTGHLRSRDANYWAAATALKCVVMA